MARNEVLDSGQLEALSNITNLVLGSSQAVAFPNYVLDILLEPAGLSIDDLKVVDIPVPNRLDALQTGAIDIAPLGEPWITRVANAGAGRIWIGYEDLLPNSQSGILAFGPTLTEQNREAGNRFMLAYLEGVQLHNEGKTDRNIKLMAEFTQLDPEEVSQMCWQSFTADGSIDADSMIAFQEWALEKGLVDAVLTEEEFFDGSFLEFANQAIEK
jgi:NitT/TauT family transport system substrate-binding protein